MNYFTEQDIPTVQKYLSNRLTGEEKTAFEQRLAQDTKLQEELEWYKAMFNAIEDQEDQRLKELLKKSDQEKATTLKVRRLNVKRWSIAAGFLLVVTVLSLLWIYAPKQQLQVEEELFEVAPIIESDISRSLISVRSAQAPDGNVNIETITDNSTQDAALVNNLYQSGKYQEALTILDTLPESAALLFLKSNALMALSRHEEAIPVLNKVETYTNETYSNFAQWYLALAYYKVGDEASAKEYALKTIQNKGIYENDRVQAQKLLEKLDEY